MVEVLREPSLCNGNHGFKEGLVYGKVTAKRDDARIKKQVDVLFSKNFMASVQSLHQVMTDQNASCVESDT